MPEFQEYPFKLTDKPEEIKSDRLNCVLYRTKITTSSGENKTIVVKELLEESYMYDNYPGNNLFEKAANMKKFFDVVKEYLGDNVVDTNILVAVGHRGKPCIMLTQDEIKGKGLREDDPEWQNFRSNQRPALEELLDRALNDERLNGMDMTKEWVRADAMGVAKNVMLDDNGKFRLIDVL